METIVNKFQVIIFTFCFKWMQNEVDAKEVTHVTFIKFYESYFNDEKEDKDIKKLLFRIARNLMISLDRKNIVRCEYANSLQIRYPNPVESMDVRDTLDEIYWACKIGAIELKALERIILETLFEKDVNPKSNEEIALESGISLDKVINSKKTLFGKIRAYFDKH